MRDFFKSWQRKAGCGDSALAFRYQSFDEGILKESRFF
jgi:hypothetical protein